MKSINSVILVEPILIFLVILLGALLYFYKLESVPHGLYVDEAVTGYNAYSLLTTGKDEYGKEYPVAMRFFGSYSPPLYTYLTTQTIAFFGLNIVAVRVVSVVAGVANILIVYLFLKYLHLTTYRFSPLIGALFFAISPWTVFYSRAGYETNLAFFIFSLAVFLVWMGFRKPIFLVFGLLMFSVATYGDHTQRILVPLFLIASALVFKKDLLAKRNRKYLVIGGVLALIMQIPNLSIILTPAFLSKTSLFYGQVVVSQAEKISRLIPIVVAIPLAFLREFLSQFVGYFSPRSLFFLPDPDPQRSLPELSVFYFWMLIPYLVGLYLLWQKKNTIAGKFIFLLAIVSPIPASLSATPFSTQRSLPLLLPLISIIIIGTDKIIASFKSIAPVVMSFLIFFSLLLLWRSYFVLFPNERARIWGYGFYQLAEEIKKRPGDVFIIDQSRAKPAYIELAFFLEYPPNELQKKVDQSIKESYYHNTKFSQEYKFANIETRNIVWEEDVYQEVILVGDELAVSQQQANEHELTKLFEIKDPLDQLVFQGYKTNPEKKCAKILYKSVHCKK